jgi:hypothetical protein
VDESTVGQFIGFCDKNKQEIYEGDKLWHKKLMPYTTYE